SGWPWNYSHSMVSVTAKHAAINDVLATGDIGACTGAEEDAQADDVFRSAITGQRHTGEELLGGVFLLADMGRHLGGEITRHHRIDSDIVRRQLRRQHPGKMVNGRLAGHIGIGWQRLHSLARQGSDMDHPRRTVAVVRPGSLQPGEHLAYQGK